MLIGNDHVPAWNHDEEVMETRCRVFHLVCCGSTRPAHLSAPPMENLLVGLLLAGGLAVPPAEGLVPRASFPAGLDAKDGRNFIPSAILISSGSSSSPANRAREVPPTLAPLVPPNPFPPVEPLGPKAEKDGVEMDPEGGWPKGELEEGREGRVGVWKVEPEGDHQSEEDMAGGTGTGTGPSGMGWVLFELLIVVWRRWKMVLMRRQECKALCVLGVGVLYGGWCRRQNITTSCCTT